MVARLFSVLGGIPLWAWALGALLAWGGYHRHQARTVVTQLKDEHAQAALANATAEADRALEGNRRLNAKQGVIDDALKKRDAAAAAARAAESARLLVNDQLDALQAEAGRRDPAAGGQCAPAEARAGLYAELYRSADLRAGLIAGEAEGYRAAGEACERSYESLNSIRSAP